MKRTERDKILLNSFRISQMYVHAQHLNGHGIDAREWSELTDILRKMHTRIMSALEEKDESRDG